MYQVRQIHSWQQAAGLNLTQSQIYVTYDTVM